MNLISWNINGIRAVSRRGFKGFLTGVKPDILCLQEIKISDAIRAQTAFDFPGYVEYWNCARRPGYSGTAILVREGFKGLKGVKNGLGIDKFDSEGRLQTADLTFAYLLNVYFPNSNHELSRLGYKQEFNRAVLKYAKNLAAKKPVIITGDFNVAHQPIDLARPKENEGNAGFTPEERADLSKLLKSGFTDTFRYLNGAKVQYSWWSFRAAARPRNVGWRIDYFLVSDKLNKRVKTAYILDKILGSDHAPIGLEIS